VHVQKIGGTKAVEVDADVPVCVASVVKVIVAFARAVSAGELDPAGIVTVRARYRIGGGAGTAGCTARSPLALDHPHPAIFARLFALPTPT
jgi:hypothetical protein